MLCCILSTSLFPDRNHLTAHGTIKDPSGALVPSFKVTLLNSQRRTFTAEAKPAIWVPGFLRQVHLTASAQSPAQSKSAELLVNQPASIDFT
jgi:hypothetical protein